MNTSAISHRTGGQMCYAFNNDDLIINLKTGYDVEEVYLHYGDPYNAGIMGGEEKWYGERKPVPFKKDLSDHIWWTTTVTPQHKRCKYYFELHSKDETLFFFEDGFLTKEQMEIPGKMLQYFIFPWMNPADLDVTPSWVNDTVWYQIFPERFARDENGSSPEGRELHEWKEGPVTNAETYGGNLSGIRKKIPYLKELGITGIYLTPIMEASSNHKYDTTDYKKIDTAFGTDEDMKALVRDAHENGIRIMMDGVFNHSGRFFKPWLDVCEKGPSSEYYDWFMINKWPFDPDTDTRDGKFFSFAFHGGMPKLNTNNDRVIDYIEDVCLGWLKEYDIDGIRFDVGNEVSHKLLKRLHNTLKAEKEDFYLLGEIWHDSLPWLLGDEYDSVMNYPLTSGINDFFIDKNNTKKDLSHRINSCYTMYRQQNNNVLFNLLDSHDTDRLMTRVGEDTDVFIQEIATLFTMPGTVCIYYGTEIGLPGGHDPDCRRVMPWDNMDTPERKEIFEEVKTLIALRKKEETFRSLYFHFPDEIKDKRCGEYIKIAENGDKIEVLLNASENDIDVPGFKKEDVLFKRNVDEEKGVLKTKGTLIRRVYI